MREPLTITTEPLEPGMDYARLRAEGQQHIASLAGHVWTDYNATDPGITLLESLCYAITDLSYRLGFAMEDLLAADPDSRASGKQFFSAREILTVNPLTVIDFRKLLIDIKGVKNAWVEKAPASETPVVYEPGTVSLSFPHGSIQDGRLHSLNGLYRVLLELDGSEQGTRVTGKVQEKLQQFRNTGEDFAEVRVLGNAEVTVKGDIEIRQNADVNEVFADIYNSLGSYLSPLPAFRMLDDRLASGCRVEDIFNGPLLDHGFLADEQVSGLHRMTEIYAADIIALLMAVKGITGVRNLRLCQGRQAPVEWVLELRDPDNSCPVLKPVSQFLSAGDLAFFTRDGANSVTPDKNIVVRKVEKQLIRERKKAYAPVVSDDISFPAGRYRNLTDYVSVQDELPGNYGIGRHGLSGTASAGRQAQAKQLQAYLMVFDQLLVNYLAQLANARELLAVKPERDIAALGVVPPTYFSATLEAEVAGVDDVITDYASGYRNRLDELVTDTEVNTDRMNRFLDHLLARHGQGFTPAAALYPLEDEGNTTAPFSSAVHVIPAKQRFLEDYVELSRDRARGFNYSEADTWDTDNVAGLKKRICRLLDIRQYKQRSLAGVEGFHLIDHILLRPVLPSGHVTFNETGNAGTVLCTGTSKHGLQDGDEIVFTVTPGGSYTQSVYAVEIADEYGFLIKQDYITPGDPATLETGIWISEIQKRDRIISFQKDVGAIGQGSQLIHGTHYATSFIVPRVHGLSEGDRVFVGGAQAELLNGLHRVTGATATGFEVDVPFDPAFGADSGLVRWHRHPLHTDPYSCRISFIFPASSGRAAAPAGGQQFRELVAEVIRKETPAHITPYLYWFEDELLTAFETDYRAWLDARALLQTAHQKIRTAKAALKVLEWLI